LPGFNGGASDEIVGNNLIAAILVGFRWYESSNLARDQSGAPNDPRHGNNKKPKYESPK
jgi:hypothetical protein